MCRRALGKLPIVLAGIASFAANTAGAPQAQELVRAETTRFSAPPPIMVVNGDMRCNPEGDVYLVSTDAWQAVVSEPGGIARLPIRVFPIGGGTPIEYAVPLIPGYLDVVRNDFDVGPHGRLYALLVGLRGKDPQTGAQALDYLIGKYGADGKLASYIKLADVPGKTSEPLRLGVFAGGGFLVAGMLFGDGQGRPFAAVFDSGGNLVSELPAPDDITPVPYGQAGLPPTPSEAQEDRKKAQELADSTRHPTPALIAISNTLIAGAPDGGAYLLWGTLPQRLYVVSPGGNGTRQFEVPAPGPGVRALRMGPAGPGKIFLSFDTAGRFVSSAGSGAKPLTILDASTGQVAAGYQLAQAEDGLAFPACASSARNFNFVRSSEDRKNLLVVRYSTPQF